MKRLISLAVIMVLLSFTAAAAQAVTVYVNGEQVVSDTPAVILDGSTMLPFRAILNALGIPDSRIIWDDVSQSIEIKDRGNFIFLSIGQQAAIVSDQMVMLNTAPYIENGRTMVPVRFVSESLGAEVIWDGINNAVYITK